MRRAALLAAAAVALASCEEKPADHF